VSTYTRLFQLWIKGLLVNNVGKSHEMPTDFVDTTQKEIDDILAINIHATLRVTSIVLPGMIQRYALVANSVTIVLSYTWLQETRPHHQYGLVCWRSSFAYACHLLWVKGLPLNIHKRSRRGS
jgi:NAD(P)-dependent dehydrogenase (short-subunit alcohol dehydrogenase family)